MHSMLYISLSFISNYNLMMIQDPNQKILQKAHLRAHLQIFIDTVEYLPG